MDELSYRDFTGWHPAELARLFNRCFAQYFVKIRFNAETIQTRLHVDGVDPRRSRIVERDGIPCGIAWIAPRSNEARLAAMGVVLEARGTGVGKALLRRLLEESEAAGEKRMVLEVIARNENAIHLYESHGFQRDARLFGFSADAPRGRAAEVEEIEADEVADAMRRADDGSLPWQMAADSLGRMEARGFRHGESRALLSVGDELRLHAVVTEDQHRRQGGAKRLLRALFARWPDQRWTVPVIVPEGPASKLFDSLGFRRLELEQLQMHRDR